MYYFIYLCISEVWLSSSLILFTFITLRFMFRRNAYMGIFNISASNKPAFFWQDRMLEPCQFLASGVRIQNTVSKYLSSKKVQTYVQKY